MANYRPKSLNELNSVYGKAMEAERAIHAGSDRLQDRQKTQAETDSTQTVFEEMEKQARQAREREPQDDAITNIANDFIKRFAVKQEPADRSREVRRPAPSIQSVYHTPVSQAEPAAKTTAAKPASPKPEIRGAKAPSPVPEVPRPSAKEPPVSAVKTKAVAPEFMPAPQPEIPVPVSAASEKMPDETQVSSFVPGAERRPASPRVHITSTERSELMKEYMSIMADDDDEAYDAPRHKKSRFKFGKKKRAAETATIREDNTEPQETDATVSEPIPEHKTRRKNKKHNNIYDDIEADFGYNEEIVDDEFSASEDVSEESDARLTDYPETREVAFEDTDDDINLFSDIPEIHLPQGEEQLTETPAEPVYEEEIIEAEAEPAYEEEFIEAEIEPVYEEEIIEAEAEPAYEEEIIEAEAEPVYEEEIIEAEAEPAYEEEIIEAETEPVYEEEIIEAETEPACEEESIAPQPESADETIPEDIHEEFVEPVMVFDDVFSVSDESKRSYTGGNWEEVFGNDPDFLAARQEAYEENGDGFEEMAYYPEEEVYYTENVDEDLYVPEVKKHTLARVFLALIMTLSFLCAGFVCFVRGVAAPNSGSVFADSYRVFTAAEAYEDCSVAKGDLVVTEDMLIGSGDTFAYRDTQDGGFRFALCMDSEVSDGEEYLVASSQYGSVRVNSADTYGKVMAAYGGVGAAVSFLSNNFSVIVVFFLLIALCCILALALGFKGHARDEDDDQEWNSQGTDEGLTERDIPENRDEVVDESHDEIPAMVEEKAKNSKKKKAKTKTKNKAKTKNDNRKPKKTADEEPVTVPTEEETDYDSDDVKFIGVDYDVDGIDADLFSKI
ncbi:MAG: hypothetical protein PUB43_07905 [Oscillospiraceae bacterium]|nr:hypothetical protein [Oscillospiraceae bacterium]